MTVLKKSLLLFIFSISNLYCQDSIHFYTNEIIRVKVTEVTIKEILYKQYDSINGLIYNVDKDKINFIKYENGLIDSFKLSERKLPVYLSNAENLDLNSSISKTTIVGNNFEYKNHKLNDKKLFILINTYAKTDKKEILLKDFRLMTKYRIIKSLVFAAGMALACPLLVMTSVYSLIERYPNYQYVIAGLGSTVVILGATIPISIINAKKQSKKQQDMFQIFNTL